MQTVRAILANITPAAGLYLNLETKAVADLEMHAKIG